MLNKKSLLGLVAIFASASAQATTVNIWVNADIPFAASLSTERILIKHKKAGTNPSLSSSMCNANSTIYPKYAQVQGDNTLEIREGLVYTATDIARAVVLTNITDLATSCSESDQEGSTMNFNKYSGDY